MEDLRYVGLDNSCPPFIQFSQLPRILPLLPSFLFTSSKQLLSCVTSQKLISTPGTGVARCCRLHIQNTPPFVYKVTAFMIIQVYV